MKNGNHFLNHEYPQRPDYFHRDRLDQLINRSKPVMAWSVKLEKTSDYKDRTVIENLPTLKPGFYRIVASWRDDFYYRKRHFNTPENTVSATSFWVSNITLVGRSNEMKVDGLVLDSTSGEPVDGVTVDGYRRVNRKWKVIRSTKTDKDGRFVFDGD